MLKDSGVSSRKVVPTKFVAAIVILLSVNERNAICRQRQEINRPSRAHAVAGRGAAAREHAPWRPLHRGEGRGAGRGGFRRPGAATSRSRGHRARRDLNDDHVTVI